MKSLSDAYKAAMDYINSAITQAGTPSPAEVQNQGRSFLGRQAGTPATTLGPQQITTYGPQNQVNMDKLEASVLPTPTANSAAQARSDADKAQAVELWRTNVGIKTGRRPGIMEQPTDADLAPYLSK